MIARRSIVALVLLSALGSLALGHVKFEDEGDPPAKLLDARLPIMGEGGIGAATRDFSGELIPVLERDAIQALDFPPNLPASALSADLYDADAEIIGVSVNNDSRAYPLRILARHEVLNDELGGVPLVVSFCPLCYSGVVFDRRVNDQTRLFGVSGVLLNSDLVMYDRQQESLWAQISGESVGGPDSGAILKRIAFTQTTWRAWLNAYPDTSVLDLHALGGADKYPAGRFGSYYGSSRSGLIPLKVRDDLEPKELVAGIRVGNVTRAYPLASHAGSIINDEPGSDPITIVIGQNGKSALAYRSQFGGRVLNLHRARNANLLVDDATGFSWSTVSGAAVNAPRDLAPVQLTISFWFGWAAFFPQTEVYGTAAP